MAKLKPRQSEADRPPSAESSGSGRGRDPKYKPKREAPSVESSGRHGPRLLDSKFRNDRGMTPSLNQKSRNDHGMIPVRKFKFSKDTSKESLWRRSSKDRDVLSSLTTVKNKTKYESASKESWHDENSSKWKKRVTRFDPHNSTTSTFKDRKVLSSINTVKKKVKYNTDTKESSLEDPPKRKKRVIRIDPHDISNKRLDDSPALSPNGVGVGVGVEEKKKSPNESELSQNAQFRAIKPTPSILSFVEDNLLGRRRSIELKRAGYNIDLSVPLDNIPLSTSSDRERIEETVFRNKLNFFAAAKVSSSFPPPDAPEIAFAGRSNVGKSSLLNALTRQWGVVRTSDKPGLTQTINFFQLGPKLRLVDLPGYGFAYAKEEVKDAWEELVKEYVSTRDGLKQVCLLIDTKWGMRPRDQELINLMERSQTKYQIVLTKTDTVFPIDVARRAWQIEDTLKVNKSIVHPVMMVSAKSGAGIRTLRTVLAKIARFAKI